MLSTVVQGEPKRKVTIVVGDVVAHLGYNAPHGNEINIHIGYSISIDFIKNYCSISGIFSIKSYFSSIFIGVHFSMWGYIILAFLLGGAIGYLVFYFQYEKKDVVSELRKNLKKANDQLLGLQDEVDELTAQNELFREKTTELLEKNDELSDVVAELGKYYVHMKKASEKTAELSKYLHEPDDDMEEKLEILSESEKSQVKNSFF